MLFPQNLDTVVDPANFMVKPKKAMNAYNIFYQLERGRIVAGTDTLGLPIVEEDLIRIRISNQTKPKRPHRKTTNGKITFQELNRLIAKRWKSLPDTSRAIFEEQARQDKIKVDRKLQEWNAYEQANKLSSNVIILPSFSKPAASSAAPQSFGSPDEKMRAQNIPASQNHPDATRKTALAFGSSAMKVLDHAFPPRNPQLNDIQDQQFAISPVSFRARGESRREENIHSLKGHIRQRVSRQLSSSASNPSSADLKRDESLDHLQHRISCQLSHLHAQNTAPKNNGDFSPNKYEPLDLSQTDVELLDPEEMENLFD